MSRASSFLGVFPSFRLRFAFPGGRGAQPGQWWGDGARPGPCPDPRGAAALPVRRLGANQSVPAELRVAVPVAPERVRVSAWGAMSGDVHRATRYTRSTTPSGTTDPGGHGSARRVGTRRCPEPTGEGSWRAQHGVESPGHSSRRSSLGPPSLLLPCVTEWHLLLRPNHLAAKVASPTSVSRYAQHNHFLACGPFPSWAAQRSWSSFPTRQQHQLQLLISSGCNPGWSRASGSC